MTTALRISAFTPAELAKCVVPEPPLIDWQLSGINLEATISLDGREYRLECETVASLDSEVIEQASAWIYEGKRLIAPESMPGLYRAVRESADEAVDRYAVALLRAHEESRDWQRAEAVVDAEGDYR